MDSSGEIRVSGYSLESRINEVFSLEGEDFNLYLYIFLNLKVTHVLTVLQRLSPFSDGVSFRSGTRREARRHTPIGLSLMDALSGSPDSL